jgi:hypothetical protein
MPYWLKNQKKTEPGNRMHFVPFFILLWMSPPVSWVHPDGDQKTVEAIAAPLNTNAVVSRIVHENVDIYESTEMKTGIVVDKLLQWEQQLGQWIRLDPRGGFFLQQDMHDAVFDAITTQKLMDEIESVAATLNQTPHQVISMVAYKFRVMLSHVLLKKEPPAGVQADPLPELLLPLEKLVHHYSGLHFGGLVNIHIFVDDPAYDGVRIQRGGYCLHCLLIAVWMHPRHRR